MMKSLIAAIAMAVGVTGIISVDAEAAVTKDKPLISIFSTKAAKKKVAIKNVSRSKIKIVRKKQGASDNITTASVTPIQPRKTTRRSCGTFTQCLFGTRTDNRRPRIQTASLGRGNINIFRNSSSGLSGRSMRQSVSWDAKKYPVGSIIVKTPERALYYVTAPGQAIRYRVGVGREGFQWGGTSKIVAKQEWPTWTPPQEMIEREAEKGHILPDQMEGGPGNPLGARAMYIGGTIYRVHGTNNEASIGGAVSSGCIRMMNADVIDLYNRVKIGSRIYVLQ